MLIKSIRPKRNNYIRLRYPINFFVRDHSVIIDRGGEPHVFGDNWKETCRVIYPLDIANKIALKLYDIEFKLKYSYLWHALGCEFGRQKEDFNSSYWSAARFRYTKIEELCGYIRFPLYNELEFDKEKWEIDLRYGTLDMDESAPWYNRRVRQYPDVIVKFEKGLGLYHQILLRSENESLLIESGFRNGLFKNIAFHLLKIGRQYLKDPGYFSNSNQ